MEIITPKIGIRSKCFAITILNKHYMKSRKYTKSELEAFRDIILELNLMYDLRTLRTNPSFFLANLHLNKLYYKIQFAITKCILENRTEVNFTLNLKDRLSLMVYSKSKLNLGIYETALMDSIFLEIQASF